jgi:mono/diheme cytochrome c family protein
MNLLLIMTRKVGLALVLVSGLLAVGAASSDSGPDEELIAKGRIIFEENAGGVGFGCAQCHGHFGMGDLQVAPNSRGASEERIRKGFATRDQMSFLRLTDEEIKAVAAFLGYLGNLHPVKVAIQDSHFEPNRVSVPTNRQIQFIFDNKGSEACNLSSEEAGIKAKSLEPGKVDDVVWISPAKAATFTARCNPKPNMILTIMVQAN